MNKVNLIVPQGETYQHAFPVLNKADNTPVDLTNYILRLMVREDFDSASPVVSLSNSLGGGFGLTLSGAGNNVINVEITASVTTDLIPGNYVYDMEAESPTGVVTRIVEGKVKVTPEVTKT